MPTQRRIHLRLSIRLVLAIACIGIFTASTTAQSERYELGRRLRAVEFAWDAQRDPVARRRAVPALNQAVRAFFAANAANVGRSLDEVRFQLQSSLSRSSAERWAASLRLAIDCRLIDSAKPKLRFTVEPFYVAETKAPSDVLLYMHLVGTDYRLSLPLNLLPLREDWQLSGIKEGDYQLRCELLQGERILAHVDQQVSVADQLAQRLKNLRAAMTTAAKKPATTEAETLRSLTGLLDTLDDRETLETDYPAARLLREAESLAKAVKLGQPFYGAKRSGEHWLTLATKDGNASVRLLVPEAAAAGKPLPLVIALHGAGGSENLFFDGYAHGAIVENCRQRGWLLVAPRMSPFGGESIAAVLDELSRMLPVDPNRVFLVGHSLGAAQAVSAAQRNPQRFAAVAALGGGGVVKQTQGPGPEYFIGVGAQDFALKGARSLRDNLSKVKGIALQYREYPDVEHMIIVQVALPDVFALFDQLAKRK